MYRIGYIPKKEVNIEITKIELVEEIKEEVKEEIKEEPKKRGRKKKVEQ